jgi:sugar lactone lactonase YvrE
MPYDIQPLGPHRCSLGESPLWHPAEQALYAVDIPARQVLRWRAGVDTPDIWPQAEEPGCIALRAQGGLIVARRDGLWTLDPETGAQSHLAPPPYDPAGQRFNDGKPDALGRLWVATLSDARAPEAALYRIDASGPQAFEAGLTVGNGLAWSPDGATLYRSDTKAHAIYRHRFDLGSGTLGPCETWATFPQREPGQPIEAYGGRPDGAAVDVEGCYWVALFEGQRLLRLSPAGAVLADIALPVRCPTMPAFGGADLRTLYLTTARDKRPADELAAQPWAGAVLQMRVDVAGLPAHPCAL